MAESSNTQKTSESKLLDPVLFPPNRGFEYKVGTKLDAQDELKKWYAAKITEVIEAEGLLLIHFEYWSQRFDELIPANSSRLRPSTVHDKKPPETYSVGDYVHSKWGGISYPAKIIEFFEPDHYKVLFYDGFVKVVRPVLMKKMTAAEIKELDLENFGKLTLMPSYPNPLFDPEINKKVTGKRRSAIRKSEDFVHNDQSAESTTTPELKPSLEIHEVSKTSLKPLPRRSHTNRPDLVDFAKRRGPVQDPLDMEIAGEPTASTSNETDQTPNIRLTRSIINAANKIFTKDEFEADEKMKIQRAHVEDSVETIFTKVIPDRKRNHESSSSTPESASKKTKRENIPSNVFESTSPVVCAKPVAVDATPVVVDSVSLPVAVVEPAAKPTEDRKALRKAAMGVAFAVAKLTPSVRAKRKSDVNSSPTSSSSLSTAGGSVTPKQSTVVADDQSTLKSLLMKPSLSLQRPATSAKNSPVGQVSIPTSDVAKSTPISPDEKLSTFVKNSPQIALPSPPADGNGPEIKTELEKIKNSIDTAAGFEFKALSETDGKETIVAPIDVKPVRKHKFAHRNRSKKSELSAKSISSKDWSRTRGKRWYETASVFKQEWKIGRENWLEFDGTYMYCRICRERYYPGQSGHNSGFVDGISNGFVVNRISSHELSTAHRSALNSPSKSRPIDEPVVGIPKIKRNKGKWNKSWKKSKTKKSSTTLSIQEEIEIVKNNDPDEEKVLAQFVADTKQKQTTIETASKSKLSPTASIRSPAVQSRTAHPCKYPMCGVSFDNAKDLCDHVQSDHRGKSSKSVVPKSKFNPKRRRRRDVSLNASDSDSQSASEMSDSTPVGDGDPDYDVQSDVDDEMKTMSTDSNLSHLAEDDLVRCICGDTEENGMMVQCEQCSMWQHGACFYLEDSDSIPVKYICYMCKNPLGVRDTVRRRFETNKSWNETGELPKYGFISDHRKEQNLDDDLKTATNCRAMSKIYQNVVNLRENLKSVRFRILVANTPDHPMLKKIIPYDSPPNENEARERLREDITRLQDEIETNLDAIEQFVTTYEIGQRNEHDFEDLNAANLFTSELIKNLAKVRKITILLEK